MVSATLKTKIMIDKKKLIEELLDCVVDATDTETQITSLTMAGMLMNEVLDEALTIPAVVGQSKQLPCEHEEITRQGDGFTYVVCGKCGEDL